MKKLLFICSMIAVSLTASAQFTVYQNVEVPPRNSTQSNSFNPFSVFESNPYNNQNRSTPQPQSKQYTLTGYYKKTDGWYHTQIRISITGDEIKLTGVKYGNNWAGCDSKVSEVGAFDTQEIKDNFNYKGYFTYLGTIYF